MFYVKLGLSLYSHTKFTLLNIDKNSIVASKQYFLRKKVSQTTVRSFIITESRNADIDFLSQLEYFTLIQRLFGEGKHVFNVTRVSLKQLNKVMSSRKICEVTKLISYNFEHLCLT